MQITDLEFKSPRTSCRRPGRVFCAESLYEGGPRRPGVYPYGVEKNVKTLPAELARAGEARHFIAWRAAVAGLGGGRLNDLAVAAEAVLTDVLLSAQGGALQIEASRMDDAFRVTITHPELGERRMRDLPSILERFLDGYEITAARAVLLKRLG